MAAARLLTPVAFSVSPTAWTVLAETTPTTLAHEQRPGLVKQWVVRSPAPWSSTWASQRPVVQAGDQEPRRVGHPRCWPHHEQSFSAMVALTARVRRVRPRARRAVGLTPGWCMGPRRRSGWGLIRSAAGFLGTDGVFQGCQARLEVLGCVGLGPVPDQGGQRAGQGGGDGGVDAVNAGDLVA